MSVSITDLVSALTWSSLFKTPKNSSHKLLLDLCQTKPEPVTPMPHKKRNTSLYSLCAVNIHPPHGDMIQNVHIVNTVSAITSRRYKYLFFSHNIESHLEMAPEVKFEKFHEQVLLCSLSKCGSEKRLSRVFPHRKRSTVLF